MPNDSAKAWRAKVTPKDGPAVTVTVPHSSPDPRAAAVDAYRKAGGVAAPADQLTVEFLWG